MGDSSLGGLAESATKFPSFNFLRAVLRLSVGVARFLAVLCVKSWDGACVLSVRTLAEAAGISRRQAHKHIAELRNSEFLRVEARVENGWKLPNRYVLKIGSELSREQMGDDWLGTVVAEFSAQHKKKYGVSGIKDEALARRELRSWSGAFHELVSVSGDKAHVISQRLVAAFLRASGRNNYLIEAAHPWRAFVEDFASLAAVVAKSSRGKSQKATTEILPVRAVQAADFAQGARAVLANVWG